MGLLVTVYTLLGGIEAVIWTDVVQSVVLMTGAVVVTLLLLFKMPEGPGQIFSIAHDHAKFSLGSFGPSLMSSTFWVVLVYGLVMNLNNFGIDQSFVQRYQTARSDREAAGSLWLSAMMYLPISAVFFFIGTALFAYCETHPEMLAEIRLDKAAELLADAEPDGRIAPGDPSYQDALAKKAAELKPEDIGDKVFPHFIVTHFYPGISGLLVAAIFAAAMSSIDTSLNSSATVLLSDIYRRYVRPAAGERESMMVLYGGTLATGALGTAFAVAMIGEKSVLDAWWKLSGIFAGGMLGLFLLGLISRKAKNAAAVTGVLIGLLVILWMTFSPGSESIPPGCRSPFHQFLIPVFGTAVIILVGLLAGLLLGAAGQSRDRAGA